ncbi:MAG TPA: flagellar assembly protein FliH, partial [Thauera aminoaromatica]|nr:flagellar assembly protein FliH [Thauera aminoaromatica]
MSISRHQAVGAYRRWEPEDFDAPAGKGSAPPPEAFAPADLAGLMQAAPSPAAASPPIAPPAPEPAPSPPAA